MFTNLKSNLKKLLCSLSVDNANKSCFWTLAPKTNPCYFRQNNAVLSAVVMDMKVDINDANTRLIAPEAVNHIPLKASISS